MTFVILTLRPLPDTCTERSTSTPEFYKSNPQNPSAMNSRNDLLFVSIHGAFMTFDPLSCTSSMESDTTETQSDSAWGGLVWNRRKRPVVNQGGGMRRQRRDDGWIRKDGNRRSANTGWVRGANPNWDKGPSKPRKVSDLAAFLSAIVLFGPSMTHMTP